MPKLTKKLSGRTDGRTDGLTDPNYRKASLLKSALVFEKEECKIIFLLLYMRMKFKKKLFLPIP